MTCHCPHSLTSFGTKLYHYYINIIISLFSLLHKTLKMLFPFRTSLYATASSRDMFIPPSFYTVLYSSFTLKLWFYFYWEVMIGPWLLPSTVGPWYCISLDLYTSLVSHFYYMFISLILMHNSCLFHWVTDFVNASGTSALLIFEFLYLV